MQAMESIFTGEQGVAYIPMPKGRGFTPLSVKPGAHSVRILPEFASWGKMSGAKSELSDGQIEERQKKQEKFKTFSCFFYALML